MIMKLFKTLIDMLEYRAVHSREKIAFTLNGKPHTYADMWGGVNQVGSFLHQSGVSPGDRVVLNLPNSAEFFSAFYGVQRVGGVAVPLFPGSGPERIFSITGLCGAKTIIVPSATPEDQFAELKKMSRKRGLQLATVADCWDTTLEMEFTEILPECIAFLQYTSGSTGNPKGVQLTHDNLLTNMVQMIEGMEITEDDIFVSWLPVYHDMGLILMTMIPFYLGTTVHLLPTDLRDVNPWLDAIQTHRGTYTAAPDFAYRLCLRHVEPDSYDLSSLRVALNAAESVRNKTVRDFESAYHLNGIMMPGYGLAEATVGVSMWRPGTKPRVDERGFVSVGPPFPGVEVIIVQDGNTLPPYEVGEIAVRSPANASGYFDNPEETRLLFMEGGYLLSGDLGYLDEDGYLYIVSRMKNIIKRSGETISPQELEEIVDQFPSVRYSAAVGIDRGRIEGEQPYIFAETRDAETLSESGLYELTLGIVIAIHTQMGFRPGRVYLLKPKSIPMTHNGKIQHTKLKNQYLNGELQKSGAVLFPDY
jgi:acyl-CoA synthetase (AMP-forming)/AMP-acid ligase II